MSLLHDVCARVAQSFIVLCRSCCDCCVWKVCVASKSVLKVSQRMQNDKVLNMSETCLPENVAKMSRAYVPKKCRKTDVLLSFSSKHTCSYVLWSGWRTLLFQNLLVKLYNILSARQVWGVKNYRHHSVNRKLKSIRLITTQTIRNSVSSTLSKCMWSWDSRHHAVNKKIKEGACLFEYVCVEKYVLSVLIGCTFIFCWSSSQKKK